MKLTAQVSETSPMVYARVSGVLYLIIIVCGIYSEIFIRSRLIVRDDVMATASNILAAEGLFRFGFIADSIMLLSDVTLAVFFYLLLKPVNKPLALLAAAFRLTQSAILGVNLLNYYAALLLLKGKVYAAAFDGDQLHGIVLLFLDLHSHGYDIGLLFFAISCFILGYLVIKSDMLPSLAGYGLMLASCVYLSGSVMRFTIPEHLALVEPLYVIPFIAELTFCLWLLLKGVKVRS